MIWIMILIAFAAWGTAMGNVSLRFEPSQVSSGAAAPLRDGTCGIFIGPSFETLVATGASEWFPQAVITHEVGHCLGYDHPTEYRPSIMIPNVPKPTIEDLNSTPHEPWFQPFTYRLTVGIARD